MNEGDLNEIGIDRYREEYCPHCDRCHPVAPTFYGVEIARIAMLPDWRVKEMFAAGDIDEQDLQYIGTFQRMVANG